MCPRERCGDLEVLCWENEGSDKTQSLNNAF